MSQGGGHGGSWLITYCDMITLLMACFIIVITFASKEKEAFVRKRDSLVAGAGGAGVAGGAPGQGGERDNIVVRYRPPLAREHESGSETPAEFSEPLPGSVAEVLRGLEVPVLGTLSDSYFLRLPFGLVFETGGKVSPSGAQVLGAVARHVRFLPYDVHLQVEDARELPRALAVGQHLVQFEALHPGRLAVGVQPQGAVPAAFLGVLLVRQR